MEFLAESIDGIVLLDMDDGRDRAAREAYNSSSSNTHPSESEKQKKNRLSIRSPRPPQPATKSFSFFTWGESSVDTRREEHSNVSAGGGAVEEEDESCLATRREVDEDEGESHDDGDGYAEEQDLDASSLSLMSSLSAASPLTLSASSLNLLPTATTHDRQQQSERYSSLSATSPLTMSASSLNLLSTTTRDRQQQSERYDDTRSSCNTDSNTVDEVNSKPAPSSAASPAPSRIPPSPAPPSIDGDNWTKHVTQRIDARTNYDCFTGTVDAITGHLLHGMMLYRRTGDMYEGPFITKYVTSSRKKSFNNNNQGGRCYYGEGTAGIKGDVIIALRHGLDGTCRYSNGMTFEGAFEDDRPKAGKWIGGKGGWAYDGQLVGVDNNSSEEKNHVGVGVMRTSLLLPSTSTSIGNNNLGSNRPKVIGIPHTLPGSVVFHGSGRFSRPDGLVYQGDFLHGLANGVGKETSAHGRGVYHGEFCDGLRHGVGTLMEDYEEESDDGGGLEGDCNCDCEEDVDERLHDQQEQGDEFLSRSEDADNAVSSTETDDNASTLEDNNDVDRIRSDHGPDFAAGGPQAAQTPTLCPCRQCNPRRSRQQIQTKSKKKRYSSGVWCAGQCEIEDCRGTVHPESNEFTEDASSACASTIATSSLASGKSVLNDSFSSLNRTTWDMLDEKWLGI